MPPAPRELRQRWIRPHLWVADWVTTDAQRPPERAPTARAGRELRRPRAFSTAHNPKVAGSNPAAAIREAPGKSGVFLFVGEAREAERC